MSQSYSSNCFSTANVIETDMQNVENNFDALRSLFSGSSAPTSPDAGQWWYDTGSSSLKIRYNSSWVETWDMDGQCVAAGQVKTASLAAGVLSTDAAGRGKMASGYITNAHVNDVDVTKVTNLNKSAVLMCIPRQKCESFSDTSQDAEIFITRSTTPAVLGRIYIPNTGANKLKVSGMADQNPTLTVTVGTSSVDMITFASTAVHDTSTYIDVTSWLGSVQTISVKVNNSIAKLLSLTVYVTT